jgi:hypothetical protein
MTLENILVSPEVSTRLKCGIHIPPFRPAQPQGGTSKNYGNQLARRAPAHSHHFIHSTQITHCYHTTNTQKTQCRLFYFTVKSLTFNHLQPMTQNTKKSKKHSVDSSADSLPVDGQIALAGPPTASKFEIADAKRRARADSLTSQISKEQHYLLFDWILHYPIPEVVEKVAAPPPEGFGLKAHPTTLQRLRSHYYAMGVGGESEEVRDFIASLEEKADLSQFPRVQTTISHLLHLKAIELARNEPDSKDLFRLIASIDKLSTLEHRRQKFQMQRERLRHLHDASHSPRLHRVDLKIVRPEPSAPPPTPHPPQDHARLPGESSAALPPGE